MHSNQNIRYFYRLVGYTQVPIPVEIQAYSFAGQAQAFKGIFLYHERYLPADIFDCIFTCTPLNIKDIITGRIELLWCYPVYGFFLVSFCK